MLDSVTFGPQVRNLSIGRLSSGAWGLLQGVGFAADAFNWPVATKQVALLILLLGIPIAFVIAWYHGDRGAQHVSRAELSIITLLLFLGGGLLWI